MLESGLIPMCAHAGVVELGRREMNHRFKLVIIMLAVVLFSAGFAWTQTGRMQSASDRPYVNDSANSGATVLADDNKIVCCWKCPDDGTMKCKVTSVSFCNKMGRQVSSCGECQ